MIRFAEKKDAKAIMNFIDEFWRKDHILARDEAIFRYEYESDDGINMALALNDEGGIDGLMGFIPYGEENRDIMLSLWKANKTDNPMLGIEILKFVMDETGSRTIACPGIAKKTMGTYQFMGFKTGFMNQWYRLGKRDDYAIAEVTNSEIPTSVCDKAKYIKRIATKEECESRFNFEVYKASNPVPFKEKEYIIKRYFNHPVYQYEVYGAFDNDKETECDTLLIFRKQPANGATALRFVDVIGNFDALYDCTESMDSLIAESDAEYADLYEVGMDEEKMMAAGWKKVADSGNIIPNYFAPFCKENITIPYCTTDEKIHLFKADGAQDRPN